MSGATSGYGDVKLFVDGDWCDGTGGKSYAILDPATGETLGKAACAAPEDLHRAATAAQAAFEDWRFRPVVERSKILRSTAGLLRSRAEQIGRLITLEQGKPLPEAIAEVQIAADTIEWFAEECRRIYGRTIDARERGVQQAAVREPVGPAAVFTPWNFPLNQAARKIAAAIAAGCSVVAKPAEETPACVASLVAAFQEAGLPHGVLNLVLGAPAMISGFLIAHPAIRKISFTGSTVVGKQLAELAGRHMKRTTMELGGHAPVIVCADADPVAAARAMAGAKFRNAGQICNSPTRFLVHKDSYQRFVDTFVEVAGSIRVGSGLDPETRMGPLANERRLTAMETLVADAVEKGARLAFGGRRSGNKGYFFEPTVLADVPVSARAMNEEPFGPMALVRPFSELGEAISEGNRLPYGLAAYAFTDSQRTIATLSARLEAGMISFNGNLVAFPEIPFGGVKDSGHGLEGGSEAIDAYLVTKLIRLGVG